MWYGLSFWPDKRDLRETSNSTWYPLKWLMAVLVQIFCLEFQMLIHRGDFLVVNNTLTFRNQYWNISFFQVAPSSNVSNLFLPTFIHALFVSVILAGWILQLKPESGKAWVVFTRRYDNFWNWRMFFVTLCGLASLQRFGVMVMAALKFILTCRCRHITCGMSSWPELQVTQLNFHSKLQTWLKHSWTVQERMFR